MGLRSASGFFRRTSCVGMMLFLQYWYWYPLSYCLSLALQPSALIGLNADLKLPKMQVRLSSSFPTALMQLWKQSRGWVESILPLLQLCFRRCMLRARHVLTNQPGVCAQSMFSKGQRLKCGMSQAGLSSVDRAAGSCEHVIPGSCGESWSKVWSSVA